MKMRRSTVALVVPIVALAGSACGDAEVASTQPADEPYEGTLHISRHEAEHPGAGAAGEVVDCTAWGNGGFSDADVYREGATADSPEQALEVARSERIFGGVQEGLRVAKREESRVLYVLEVDGAIKQAVIVRDGPATEGAGGPGWYVESWARCDYAEFPRSFTESLGLQIWTDSAGRPVPTTTIESRKGPEHCDWQSMTFLHLDEATYVRNPDPGLDEYFAEPYQEHSDLPPDAINTGFEHDGEHLWLSADEQRAFVGTEDDVEVWPRTIERLACA